MSDVYHEPGSVENGYRADYQEKHTPELIRQRPREACNTHLSKEETHNTAIAIAHWHHTLESCGPH